MPVPNPIRSSLSAVYWLCKLTFSLLLDREFVSGVQLHDSDDRIKCFCMRKQSMRVTIRPGSWGRIHSKAAGIFSIFPSWILLCLNTASLITFFVGLYPERERGESEIRGKEVVCLGKGSRLLVTYHSPAIVLSFYGGSVAMATSSFLCFL